MSTEPSFHDSDFFQHHPSSTGLQGLALTEEPPKPAVRPAKSIYEESAKYEFLSPTLQEIWNEPNPCEAAVRLYWSRRGEGPLIEGAGDGSQLTITFLYLGDEDTRSVAIWGGPIGTDHKPLQRFGLSPLWFMSELAPLDARFAYSFSEQTMTREAGRETMVEVWDLLDEINPYHTSSGYSMLVMPRAPTITKNPLGPISQGRLTTAEFQSRLLGGARKYTLYTPPDRQPSRQELGVLVCFDGEAFAYGWPDQETGAFVPTPEILDQLISEQRIPPLAAVFVHVIGSRDADLLCNPAYADFICDELLPELRQAFGLSARPERAIAAGSSYGGLCAAYCAYRRSESVGNVLSMSGSYWVTGEGIKSPAFGIREGVIQHTYLKGPKLPLRFFLEAGYFEPPDILLTNRHLRDLLIARGYEVSYREYPGNHDYMRWGTSIADGLVELTKDWTRG